MATYRRLTQDERLAAHKAALGDDPDAAREGRAALLEDVDALILRLASKDFPPPRGVEFEDYLQELRLHIYTHGPRNWTPGKWEWTTIVSWQVRAAHNHILRRVMASKRGLDASRVLSLEAMSYYESTADDEPDDSEPVDFEKAFVVLTAREADILRRRFGLDGTEPQSLGDVAAVLRISRERVRQIQDSAIDALRPAFGVQPEGVPRQLCTVCGVPATGLKIAHDLMGVPLCRLHYRERRDQLAQSNRRNPGTVPGVNPTPSGTWKVKVGAKLVGSYTTYEDAVAARERFLATGGREAV